ncbi:DUF1929 domain-containing protein [Fulvimarina endophytica]|uniref:DUF1929 domain-containing protein n=1 Tax=Fulvimarina endophytica TaxID=2293836 RepID=A0A371X4I5_9HYPH|nr:cadherin-like domain-containing protein [Fulvimarina endophytica]RFC64145.1 DUF1929 domain-containing protein [Fulvimarina endophytica]
MANVIQSTIDQEQITGAFALAVDARFDDLSAGPGQTLFDFNNGNGVDNIRLSQVGDTNAIEFVIMRAGAEYRVVAENAIVEGETATWRVGIDPTGVMRIAKNQQLLVEGAKGDAVLPADVVRESHLVGQSSDPANADLSGLVLNLKIANYGNVTELDPAYQGSPCATTGEVRCFCDTLTATGEKIAGENSETRFSPKDAEGDGEWSQVQSLGVIPIHAMVLPDGKVLSFGSNEAGAQTGQFVYSLYDPTTGVDKILPNTTGVDIFCSNMSLDPVTGNVIILGGDARGEGGWVNTAVNDVVIFDYQTQTLRNAEAGDMHFDRWYGSSVTLPNGEIFIVGGAGGGDDIPEIYNPVTGPRVLWDAKVEIDFWYPKIFVRSDGKVIVMSKEGGVFAIGTEGTGSSERVGQVEFDLGIDSAAIMYREDKVLVLKEDGDLYTMDLNASWLGFTKVVDLNTPRHDAGMVMLPDGRVLIAGGSARPNDLATADDSIKIWDPETNEIESGPGSAVAHLYHSSYAMLPNGTVWVGGGGAPGPLINTNVEFYAPSYFYGEDGELARRPEITDAPRNIEAAASFTITVDDTSDIARITAQRTGASTHATNSDTRFLELDFRVVDATTIEVQPAGASMLPGSWMMFVLDDKNVPSMAAMLGVDMAPVVATDPILPGDARLEVYGIDKDPIDGPFDLTVEARFDDLDAGPWQRVFDFGNGAAQDNVLLSQVGVSRDMQFEIFVGNEGHRIVAPNALVEGETAKWSVSVSDSGYMKMWKNDVLVAEGQGAVPRDVDRVSNLIGQSNWTQDTPLHGMVRFLETVNEGDLPEYVHIGLPKISIAATGNAQAGDGESVDLVFRVALDQAAPSVVTAKIAIAGGTGPSELIIPAGGRGAEIVVSVAAADVKSAMEKVSVSLTDLTQARAGDTLEASALVFGEESIRFGDKIYAEGTPGLGYFEAKAEAERMGGKLVEIGSAEENAFVHKTFGGEDRIWLGLSDAVTEGVWQNGSGKAAGYLNFAPGEPNDYGGSEDFAEMRPDGLWNDVDDAPAARGRTVIEFAVADGAKEPPVTPPVSPPVTEPEPGPEPTAYAIDGVFTATVVARFDDVAGGEFQRLFDFGNGVGADNVWMGQLGRTNDIAFEIWKDGVPHQVVAKNAIVEGETAVWAATVDAGGVMRIYKDFAQIAMGEGVVPADVDRTSELVGRSNWGADTPLIGEVLDIDVDAGLHTFFGSGSRKTGEFFFGSPKDESLTGTAGHDRFGETKGVDRIDGRAGFDTVMVSGSPDDYRVSVGTDGSVVLRNVTSPAAETKIMLNVEAVYFSGPKFQMTMDTVLSVVSRDGGGTPDPEPPVAGNAAPVAKGDALWFSLSAGEAVTGETAFMLFNDTDPDGDPLQVVSVSAFSARGAAVKLRDTNGDGVFDAIDYDPTVSAELSALSRGSQIDDVVEYTISDGKGGTATARVDLTIDGVAEPGADVANEAPVANDDHLWFSLAADEAVTGETGFMLYNDTDPDGDPIQVVSIDAFSARGAAVRLRDTTGDGVFDSVDYDPTVSVELKSLERGSQVDDQISYTISDGEGGTASATIHLTIDGTALPLDTSAGSLDAVAFADLNFADEGSVDADTGDAAPFDLAPAHDHVAA